MFAFLEHIRGLLEVEFGRKQVTEVIERGERTEAAILSVDYLDTLNDLLKGLLDEVNRDAGARYRLNDIDHVSFDFTPDREGGKIHLVAYSTQIVNGCETDKGVFRACYGDALIPECAYRDDETSCLKYQEEHKCMKIARVGKAIVSTTFSAVGVKVIIPGRVFK
jgi:hypothetical protein